MQNQGSDSGYFSVFGIVPKNREWISNYFSEKIGIKPSVITYPDNQSLFFYTNHGDLAETPEAISLKFGFARSMSRQVLTSRDILEQRLVTPDKVQSDRLTGNFLQITISKLEPKLSAYLSLFGTPQLFYTRWEGGILFSTNTPLMVNILQKVEVDEETIPILFLFRKLPGPRTFYRNIYRLFLGELLTWTGDRYSVNTVTTMRSIESKDKIKTLDLASLSNFSKNITEIMGTYVKDLRGRNKKFMTMLSGGVDSSTMQILINRNLSLEEKPQSISYIWDAKSFQFEVDYAKTASDLLHTQHTFFEIPMQEYGRQLADAIRIMGQPNVTPVISAKFVLAQHLKDRYPSTEYLFNGLCSDCLFGIDYYTSMAFRYGRIMHHVPGYYALMRLSILSSRPSKKKSRLAETIGLLARKDTWSSLFVPTRYSNPVTRVNVADIIDIHRRVFGDKVLIGCLDYRDNLCAKYTDSRNPMEMVQDIDIISGGYESAIHNYVLFLSQRKKTINFFLDQELFQLVRAFDPGIRYMQGKIVKPIIKNILTESSLDAIAFKKKGGSSMNDFDMHHMITNGALKELFRSIERPGFMNKQDFDDVMSSTDGKNTGFLWDLLNWDIFLKQLKGRIV